VTDSGERLDRLRRLVDAEPPGPASEGVAGRLDQICGATARWLPAAGAGVTLMDRSERPIGAIAASSEHFRRIEEVQFTLGEGPCVDAYTLRSPVLVPSLARQGASRWPGYSMAARGLGVGAVFAFPLQVGAARVGVLDVYRTDETTLEPEAVADALGFATICLETLLSGDQDGSDGAPADIVGDAFRGSFEVYQAQGKLAVQLGVSLEEAMVRLRAHSYALNRPVGEVARDVLAGTMVLSQEDQ